MFPFFQSLWTSSDCHEFSNIMESGLATTLANSLRTLRRISSGPMDLCMFRFLRWSRTWSSLPVGGTYLPQSLSCGPSTRDVWKEGLSVALVNTPWPTQGKRNIGPEKGKEVWNLVLFQILFQSLQFLYSSFSGGLTWSSGVTESQKCWLEGVCGKSSKSSMLLRKDYHLHKTRSVVLLESLVRHWRMDILPSLCSSVALPSR